MSPFTHASKLTHLADEICAGAEIYFTGRTGGQYWKTAFILCDDYTELASKLFLLEHGGNWSEQRSGGGFKGYKQILKETEETMSNRAAAAKVAALQRNMDERRARRNGFFHSAGLLDLNVSSRACVEAYCDLFGYCELLFEQAWATVVEGARNLATLIILFGLERAAFANPDVTQRASAILADWPRNKTNSRRKGVHMAEYPEDLHLRLCVTAGGKQLRNDLARLLGEC